MLGFFMFTSSHGKSQSMLFSRNNNNKNLQQHVCAVSTQESLLETKCLGFALGAGHVDTLCLACTKMSDPPEEKQVFSINYVVLQSGHTEPLLSVREW